LGGAVLYRRGEIPQPLEMPPVTAVILDSGTAGNTADMVALVTDGRPENDALLGRLGELVERSVRTLEDVQSLGDSMNEAHAVLAQLGVSTPDLDELVALAKSHRAFGAKLSGAGGGGIVLALVDHPEPLLRAARDRGISAFSCTIPAPESS
jgi:mevalonate kinase